MPAACCNTDMPGTAARYEEIKEICLVEKKTPHLKAIDGAVGYLRYDWLFG